MRKHLAKKLVHERACDYRICAALRLWPRDMISLGWPTCRWTTSPRSGDSGFRCATIQTRSIATSGQVDGELDPVQGVGALARAFGRQLRHRLPEELTQDRRVLGEHPEHLLLGDPAVALDAGVEVGHERDRRVAQRQLAGQHGLRMTGHV